MTVDGVRESVTVTPFPLQPAGDGPPPVLVVVDVVVEEEVVLWGPLVLLLVLVDVVVVFVQAGSNAHPGSWQSIRSSPSSSRPFVQISVVMLLARMKTQESSVSSWTSAMASLMWFVWP